MGPRQERAGGRVNPWLILAVGVAWLLSLVGVGKWQNTAGHTSEKTYWLAKETRELAEANSKIILLTDEARRREQAVAGVLAAVTTDYERKLTDGKKKRDADVAASHAGTFKLRYSAPSGACPSPSVPAETPSAPGGRDGTETAELPGEITASLFAIVDDADQVVEQLSACQAIINADRGM